MKRQEVAIFGDYILPEGLFKEVFKASYEKKFKGFKDKIETMLESENLMKAWSEFYNNNLFNSPVQLVAITKSNEKERKFHFVTNMNELLYGNNKPKLKIKHDIEKQITNILAFKYGDNIQAKLSKHIEDFEDIVRQKVEEKDKESLGNALFSRYNSKDKTYELFKNLKESKRDFTYFDLFYESQKSKGKMYEAFFNHVGQSHKTLYYYFFKPLTAEEVDDLSKKTHLTNADLIKFYNNRQLFFHTLIDSLNSTSGYKIGDIIVTNRSGKTLFNIQAKTVQKKSKNFDLAIKELTEYLTKLKNSNTIDEAAQIMFNTLKFKFDGNIAGKISTELKAIVKKAAEEGIK